MGNQHWVKNLPFGRRVNLVVVLAASLIAMPLWAAENSQPDNSAEPQTAADTAQPSGTSYAQVPATLTLQTGTLIVMRTSDYLSSKRDKPGELFHGALAEPLVVNGWVIARRGQTVIGRVDVAKKAGRIHGVSQLGVSLSRLILVDGQQIPVTTQLMRASGGTSKGRDAAAVGTTSGIGAIIGAAANGGEGAGIGAAIGAGAGLAGVLLTRGRPAVIEPETELTFELQSPVTISTSDSQVAFRPVAQGDYSAGRRAPALSRRQPAFVPPCPGCGYPLFYSPWWYGGFYYPGPFFLGYWRFGYGGFGWGYHRGFRRGYGRGFRR